MTNEKQTMSESKRRIAIRYDAYLEKKGFERSIGGLIPRYIWQARSRKKKFSNQEPPIYEQKYDIDSTDLENRIEIWIEGRKTDVNYYHAITGWFGDITGSASDKVLKDSVGKRLYDLAIGKRPRFCYMSREDKEFARNLLYKMEIRTMTEQEYTTISELSPRQLLKQWRKARAKK